MGYTDKQINATVELITQCLSDGGYAMQAPILVGMIEQLKSERNHEAKPTWEKEEGWTNLGAAKGEGIGGLEAKYDGAIYVDIRSTDNKESRIFISKPALERALTLFDDEP